MRTCICRSPVRPQKTTIRASQPQSVPAPTSSPFWLLHRRSDLRVNARYFQSLISNGRDGRGTLLFFSAGNHKPPQDFTLATPWTACKFTIAVTASSLASEGVEETGARESNFGGGSARIDLCAPSVSWLGASYEPPNSQAIVTTADHSFIDPDFNLQPNAPSRLIARTTSTEPAAAQATALAVASTERFHLDEFLLIGTPGASDAEFSQVTGHPDWGTPARSPTPPEVAPLANASDRWTSVVDPRIQWHVVRNGNGGRCRRPAALGGSKSYLG
jgi:hypothetical protein